MAADPIHRLARARIIKLSAEIEAELIRRGNSPTLEVVKRLQERAAESLSALAFVNIHEPQGKIQFLTLQNEVKRYDEFIQAIGNIISEGVTYDNEMTMEEREELVDILMETKDGVSQAVELGLIDLEQKDA